MGTLLHPITIVGPNGGQTFEALVDTNACFGGAPAQTLRGLGLTPRRRPRLRTADERVSEWEIGRASTRINGTEEETLFIFAPEGSPPVIGSHTLRSMLLAVAPVEHRLVPTGGFLL